MEHLRELTYSMENRIGLKYSMKKRALGYMMDIYGNLSIVWRIRL